MFEETGEFRKPLPGEWYLEVGGEPCLCYGNNIPAERILKFTEYPSNPISKKQISKQKETKKCKNQNHVREAKFVQAVQEKVRASEKDKAQRGYQRSDQELYLLC